jgi:hypothetical protein
MAGDEKKQIEKASSWLEREVFSVLLLGCLRIRKARLAVRIVSYAWGNLGKVDEDV